MRICLAEDLGVSWQILKVKGIGTLLSTASKSASRLPALLRRWVARSTVWTRCISVSDFSFVSALVPRSLLVARVYVPQFVSFARR